MIFKFKNLTMRVLMTLVSLSLLFTVISIKSSFALNLKTTSIVTERSLKLGDIFDGLTKNAEYVLGNSPQPGQEMVLNARTLYRIAHALDLEWRPSHEGQSVTIRRAATVIPFKRVEDQISDALIDNGVAVISKIIIA